MSSWWSPPQLERKARCFESGDQAMSFSLLFASPEQAVMRWAACGLESGAASISGPLSLLATVQAIHWPSGEMAVWRGARTASSWVMISVMRGLTVCCAERTSAGGKRRAARQWLRRIMPDGIRNGKTHDKMGFQRKYRKRKTYTTKMAGWHVQQKVCRWSSCCKRRERMRL